ncbi:DUF4124 domain-containing protein [Pseudomonas sp. F1_0610]|uniref:DUF4124 domain-containing protein n=1 Tax=Pseudomonas sp. F1_0610 TaxID=3114284 RepID=UPI0039C3014E
MRKLSLCLLLAISLPATAQIYRYKDAQGNTVFTDKLPPDAKVEQVEVAPINSIPAPDKPVNTTNNNPDDKNLAPGNTFSVFEIGSLPTEDAIRANNGSFSFNVTTVPPLPPTISLQLLVDGEPYGAPVNTTSLSVTELDRGEHQLAVQALVGEHVVQTSNTVTVFIQRVHVNKPKS